MFSSTFIHSVIGRNVHRPLGSKDEKVVFPRGCCLCVHPYEGNLKIISYYKFLQWKIYHTSLINTVEKSVPLNVYYSMLCIISDTITQGIARLWPLRTQKAAKGHKEHKSIRCCCRRLRTCKFYLLKLDRSGKRKSEKLLYFPDKKWNFKH